MPTCDMCNGSEPNHYNKVYIVAEDIEAALGIFLPDEHMTEEIKQAVADRVADNIEEEIQKQIVIAYHELCMEETLTSP